MIKKLFGFAQNPDESDEKNPSCELCDKESENYDEYCEDHQRCYYCAEREDCECKDCTCGKRLDSEHPMCGLCRE